MDKARLPFSMKATVTYGDSLPEPLPDHLPPDWVRIPVSFQVTLPPEVMERAHHRGSAAGSGHGPATSVSIVPNSLRLGTGSHPEGAGTWQDFNAQFGTMHEDPSSPGPGQVSQSKLTAALGREQKPVLPLPPEAPSTRQDLDASVVPFAPALRQGSTDRFDMDRLAHADLNSLGLGDTLRPRPATRANMPLTTASSTGPAPTAIENDFPGAAGRVPPRSTGNRALDIVMKPSRAAIPSAIRTATDIRSRTPDANVAPDVDALRQRSARG